MNGLPKPATLGRCVALNLSSSPSFAENNLLTHSESHSARPARENVRKVDNNADLFFGGYIV